MMHDLLLGAVRAKRSPAEKVYCKHIHLKGFTLVICLVVFWRFRSKLSLRDLAEMFLQGGIRFTHEAVRDWEAKLAPLLSDTLRKRRSSAVGNSWSFFRPPSRRSQAVSLRL